jgi:hypothetical protein
MSSSLSMESSSFKQGKAFHTPKSDFNAHSGEAELHDIITKSSVEAFVGRLYGEHCDQNLYNINNGTGTDSDTVETQSQWVLLSVFLDYCRPIGKVLLPWVNGTGLDSISAFVAANACLPVVVSGLKNRPELNHAAGCVAKNIVPKVPFKINRMIVQTPQSVQMSVPASKVRPQPWIAVAAALHLVAAAPEDLKEMLPRALLGAIANGKKANSTEEAHQRLLLARLYAHASTAAGLRRAAFVTKAAVRVAKSMALKNWLGDVVVQLQSHLDILLEADFAKMIELVLVLDSAWFHHEAISVAKCVSSIVSGVVITDSSSCPNAETPMVAATIVSLDDDEAKGGDRPLQKNF